LHTLEQVTQTSSYSAPLDTKEIQVGWSCGREGAETQTSMCLYVIRW